MRWRPRWSGARGARCSGLGLSSVKSGGRWAMSSSRVSPDIVEHVRLVALDGEQVVGAAPEEIGGQRALGEQGIGGDGAPCDVGHRPRAGEDGTDLVGALLPSPGSGLMPIFLLQGRLGVVADDAEHMRLAALVIDGAAQRLAVDGQGSVG